MIFVFPMSCSDNDRLLEINNWGFTGMNNNISHKNSLILDVMRIIATWSVLVGHACSFFKFSIFKDQTYFPYIQNIGVILLFLISGFLTLYSLQSGKYGFRSYIHNRICRIWIPYIFALVFVCTLDGLVILVIPEVYDYYNAYNFKTFMGNILFMQDIPQAGVWVTSFGSGRQFWTLAVEWWYYLCAGYILLFFLAQSLFLWDFGFLS